MHHGLCTKDIHAYGPACAQEGYGVSTTTTSLLIGSVAVMLILGMAVTRAPRASHSPPPQVLSSHELTS